MIALLQRVSEASVRVNGREIARIGRGLLALVAVQRGDCEAQAHRLAERLLAYRVFPDAAGRMADADLLTQHAQQIRAALESS